MTTAPAAPRDVAITFAGGGNRAFYQLGLLHYWGERLRPRLGGVAACGVGACVALVWLTGRETQTLRFWRARRQGVRGRFEVGRLLRGKRPDPRPDIYRDTLMCAFSEDGLPKVRALPFPVLVTTAVPPRLLPARVGSVLGIAAKTFEQRLRKDAVHPVAGRSLGFRSHVVDARDCQSPQQLTDLIIASSTAPSLVRSERFGGRRLVDGGLVDDVPASVADSIAGVRRNVVLLTRRYPASKVGDKGNRLYVAPSGPSPMRRGEHARAELVDRIIEQGERDAEVHGRALRRFLVR